MYVTRFTFYRLVERDNRHSFTRCFHLLLLRKSQIDTTELYLYVTLHPCICCYRNEQRFPLLLETNNAFRVVTQTYFNFTIQSISAWSKSSWHFKKQERVSQAYEMSVSKKRVPTKRTTLHFVVGNKQRFPLLLGTNSTLRLFMVLSETKSALVIKNFSMLLPIYSPKFWSF